MAQQSWHLTDWLRSLGLEQYGPAFRENEVDAEVLRELTGEDLRELGVSWWAIGASCWLPSLRCPALLGLNVRRETPPSVLTGASGGSGEALFSLKQGFQLRHKPEFVLPRCRLKSLFHGLTRFI
jgi:hypothetical protein